MMVFFELFFLLILMLLLSSLLTIISFNSSLIFISLFFNSFDFERLGLLIWLLFFEGDFLILLNSVEFFIEILSD